MAPQSDFAVNGRFLGKPVTGVQRYALNTVMAMNRALTRRGASAPIIAPAGTPDPGLIAMPLIVAGALSGHAWEQVTLPVSSRVPLLSLCNTGPVVQASQVVCLHDANVFEASASYDVKFRVFYKLVQPLLARRALKIATVSQHSAMQISRWMSVRAADIIVLSNGHEHALAWRAENAGSAPQLFRGPGALEPGRFVLAIGSRARHKNMSLLVQLAPDLAKRNLEVVIVGGKANIFAGDALRAAPNVHFTGKIADDDLAYLLDRALCLVFPSWTEGFGLPILEAMARGCPVVSSDRASMPEVCGDAGLLAPPDQPPDWLSHISRLAGSEDLRADLIGRGKARLPAFAWATTGEGYLDLMQNPALRRH